MMPKILLTLLMWMVAAFPSQPLNPDLLTREWPAKWIAVPGEPANGYGVYLFRKSIHLETVPAAFVVHVSADNRYKLYVNEKLVSVGPARSDLLYWNYETADLAPFLVAGNNFLAAQVWNEGGYRPEAQLSWRTGFILQGDTAAESAVNTNNTWKGIKDPGYQPLNSSDIPGYYVAGPGEILDMRQSIKGWSKRDFDDSSWKNAGLAYWSGGAPKGLPDASGWMLVPSTIPQMELSLQRLQKTRDATGIVRPDTFPASAGAVHIPANATVSLLLDNGSLTNAYVSLQFSGGRDAEISLEYAESLYKQNAAGRPEGKGNRNEVKGKKFLGRKDRIISDGSPHQMFTSLYWRTYRYILMTVHTGGDPVVVDDIYGTFTGYPFQLNAKFISDRPDLQKVLEIGWRTARLCAIETYMDCPYYEQLQYIGDTRIQALISLYNSGDDRLLRNALNQMDHSRIAEGITLSRNPTSSPQIIPTFALWYIGMLHDYWMYGRDPEFVKEKIPGTRQVMEFFQRYQQADGSLRNVPYWNFTDWVQARPGWIRGMAPIGKDGGSAVLDFQLLWAFQTAAELEKKLGMEAHALRYDRQSAQLMQTIRRKYWDKSTFLFADTAEKNSFSQHANALAILTGTVRGKDSADLAQRMLEDKLMAPASIYFKYYLHMALIKAGRGNDYLQWLDKWYENIAMGLTTWAENYDVENSRSDCHAWGSSPNIELYRTVLGIDTDAPGFARVKIEPRLGALKKAGGEIPHPQGKIAVDYEFREGKWQVKIDLPGSLLGTLIWKDRAYSLRSGKNELVF